MPLNVRTYTDLDFNFGSHPIMGDVNLTSGSNAVIQSLQNLLLTDFGEVPFHPEIGANIRALLFENITPITTSLLERHIQDCIRNFENRVTISQLKVDPDYINNGYNITLTFFIKNLTTPVTITSFLERSR